MSEDARPPQQIEFHYIKSPAFRTVHVDGVFGGLRPTGEASLAIAVFSERLPIPQRVTVAIDEGKVGAEIERVSRRGIVRELDAELIMSMTTAQTLYDWLGTKLEEFRARTQEAEEENDA